MKITKKQAVKAATMNDMLNAFEDKLAEFGVSAKTDVTCSETYPEGKEVPVMDGDEAECYIDVQGVYGRIGEKVSLADAKNYWNENYESDPVLEEYDYFEDWWDDTVAWLEPCLYD